MVSSFGPSAGNSGNSKWNYSTAKHAKYTKGNCEFYGLPFDSFSRGSSISRLIGVDVLQHERRGPVVINDVGQREEEVALFLVLEAVLFAKAQFLGDARDAERLAGKAGAQDVVRGNVRHGHGVDVAVRALAVIGFVGDLRHLVPVGGEDALPTRALEGVTESANAAEEINETQW